MAVEDPNVLLDVQVSVLVLVRVGEGLPKLVLSPPDVSLLEHETHG